MTPTAYNSVPASVQVLVWPDATADDVSALIGANRVNLVPGTGTLQVLGTDGVWTTVQPGWNVALTAEGHVLVLSGAALSSLFRLP